MKKVLILLVFLFSFKAAFACDGFNHAMENLEFELAQADIPQSPDIEQPQSAVTMTAPNGVEAVFPESFPSRAEMDSWAMKSTLGGGRTTALNINDKELVFAFRSYTSGVRSSDIGVYQKLGDKLVLIKAHPPIWKSWVRVERVGDLINFRSEDIKSPVIMTLTPADLR
jgi:hypothetical protein